MALQEFRFSRNGGVGWTVGLDDLRGVFQPMILWFYDPVLVLDWYTVFPSIFCRKL